MGATQPPIKVHIPYVFARRSSKKRIVIDKIESTETRRSEIQPIVAAIALAFRWRQLIESGEYGSITELAKAKSINQSYACRMMKLTFLSPRIVEAVLNAQVSNFVTLKTLTAPMPKAWSKQDVLGSALKDFV